MDVAFYRSSLQVMEKDNKESIQKYAYRWREEDVQVNPYLFVKEMISLFSNTFKASYFKYLVISSAQHFTDLVVIIKRIEQTIWLGKIADSNEENGFTRKRKETKVHKVEGGYKGKRKNYQNKDTYPFNS
jgi:hypothetical protein